MPDDDCPICHGFGYHQRTPCSGEEPCSCTRRARPAPAPRLVIAEEAAWSPYREPFGMGAIRRRYDLGER